MSQEAIAKWSGRRDVAQNRVYDHRTDFERVEQCKRALFDSPGRGGAKILSKSAAPLADSIVIAGVEKVASSTVQHWDVNLKPKPVSCAEIDLGPRGANHVTMWGVCEHDFLFSPCDKFGDCLNCVEHYCVKGAGASDLERLDRIKFVLSAVEKEVIQATRAVEDNNPGASKWLESQSKYRARLITLVGILEDEAVPQGALIKPKGANEQSHLHRILRNSALMAVTQNVLPSTLVEEMLCILDSHLEGHLGDKEDLGNQTSQLRARRIRGEK
ncbi:hypothetical protein [Rugamonas apoptosis]|uniref:Uncharacterized protein n=1 Tax=Rugamonas apoptosis TaxID=2758570 RepID=A0A7W2ILY3_9BURK|nr:hypothetical protein [Rugamonas apoptosis]MBA5688937.1 hypothetical protein [Rugamonas apoptosis]